MADTGGCSANEATSFARVSVAKRLCRIVRAVGCKAAVIMTKLKGNAAAAATPHPLYCVQHLLLKEKASVDRKKAAYLL